MGEGKENSGSRAKRTFDILVGCAQIIGTVIGVLALIVAFLALFWAITHPQEAIEVVRVISGEPTVTPVVPTDTPTRIPANTPTLRPPTNTPTPELTDTPTSTPVPPTNTPIPTATLTPTITRTPTDTPTPTFTPTPVPPPEFYDSFDGGLRTEWRDNADDWASINGQLVSLKKDVWLRTGHETWSNYSVEVDVLGGGLSHGMQSYRGAFCNIVILATERDHNVKLRLYQTRVEWYSNSTAIPKSTVDGLKLPYTVRVTAQGSLITTFINNRKAGEMNLSGYDR